MTEPVANVQWIPIEKVAANDYNPNAVAREEMSLLHHSIKKDGYTQPVVAVYDETQDRYIIVDGFHRYLVMRENADIRERTGGLLPVVVIDKNLEDRMAATVRHNRARGAHAVTGMANLVYQMLESGMTESQVCEELGMSADEVVRLKHITGFARLYEGAEYTRSWQTRKQIHLRRQYKESES